MNVVKNETHQYLTEDELVDLWNITRDTDIPEDELKKISAILSEYVSLFISDGLSQLDRNFLKFTQQRKLTFAILKDSIEKYGDELVLHGLALDNYLFVHSLLALEQQGYLDIKELNENNARVLATQKLLGELGIGIMYINGKLYLGKIVVTISNSRNNTQHFLLEAIFSDKDKLWDFEEIAEYQKHADYDPKNDWNKYYQTGVKINKKIKQKAGIDNFLEVSVKNISINKQYLE